MGGKQILEKIEKVDMVLDFGGEKVVVGEIKKSEVKKGKPFKVVMEKMKKAAKDDLFPAQDQNVFYQ